MPSRLLILCGMLALGDVSRAAQAAAIDLAVTGEYRPLAGDTAELRAQLAFVDAREKMVRAAVSVVRDRPEVKALTLTDVQLDAYVAAIIDIEETASNGAQADPALVRLPVRMRLEPGLVAQRVRALSKDEEAARAVLAAWTRMQQLRRQLAGDPRAPRRDTVAALNASYLAACASAAIARTEPSTVGGYAPSEEGRRRAKVLLDRAVALAPASTEVRTAMGDFLIDAELPADAEAEYRTALSTDDQSVVLRTKLAEALRLQGKFDQAVIELRAVMKSDPTYAQAHSDLGMIFRAQRNVPEAIAAYREAIRRAPDSADAHNGLAITLAENGRVDEAIAEFREIVRIDLDSAIGYYNLATALAAADRDVEAAAALREVVRINPNHYNARYNLGELFRLEGKYDESATQFREYLRLAPETPQNRRNIQRARQFVQQFSNE